MQRVLITGANGFLGRHVVAALLRQRETEIIASDCTSVRADHARVSPLVCDLHDSALHDAARGCDAVIHLAATLGGAAEMDPEAAFQTNVTDSLALMAACRHSTRFVFASSLAVLGGTAEDRAPVLNYGTHKAMVEIALEAATRRGDMDGVSLRAGTIVARRDHSPALISAFLSRLFWAVAEGEDLTIPVSAEGRTWLVSVQAVAAQFVHALTARLGPGRSLTLPMCNLRFGELVEALHAAHPQSTATITYAPDPDIMALLGQAHPVNFEPSLALGFRCDANPDALVRAAVGTGDMP